MTEGTEGRTALVTGGSRGLGRAIALRLSQSGAAVAVNYASNAAAADSVVAEITSAGGRASAYRADVADEDEVTAMIEAVGADLGPVGILVNNAGVTRDNLLLRMSASDFDEVLAVNLRSAFLCTRAVLKGMLRARWGRIISIASVAGITGNAGQANYSASKAGLIGFTKAVAKEVGSRGITANVIAPGFISTDMTDGLPQATRETAINSITLGRFGEPTEVAALAAFMASEDAGYMTGQVVAVDGGIAL